MDAETWNSRTRVLYAKLDRACVMFILGVVLSWLFTAFSYYWTNKSGTDWFTRSGAIMALVGAISTFRLSGLLQTQLATSLKEGLTDVHREIELTLEPPKLFQRAIYFGYITGIVGTIVWGYGDVLSKWISSR